MPGGQVTVKIRALTGTLLVVGPLDGQLPLRELKAQVREEWKWPIALQRLVIGTEPIEGDDTQTIQAALGEAAMADCEVTCVRAASTPKEQEALNEHLLRAVAACNLAEVEECLLEGADPGASFDGLTALLVAHAAYARRLLPRSSSEEESQPMQPHVFFQSAEEVLTLLQHHATSSSTEQAQDQLPVQVAGDFAGGLGTALMDQNFVQAVELIATGCNLNEVIKLTPEDRQTRGHIFATAACGPLHMVSALHTQHKAALAVAILLIGSGADLMLEDEEGDTPLAHARYHGAEQIYEVLKAHGARIEGPYFAWRRVFQ